MAGPWEEYASPVPAQQSQNRPPWEEYAAPQPKRSPWEMLTGSDGGERYQTWPERAARAIVSGAVSGATLPGDVMRGAASPDDTGRVLDLATVATPVNPAVRAGDRMVPGVTAAMRPKKPLVPSTEELAKAGGSDIQAAVQSGLEVAPSAVTGHSRKVQQELFDAGISPIDAPATFAKLKALEDAPPGAIFTAAGLQSLRKSLQATAQNYNPAAATDQLAASRAIKGFDQFIPSLAEADVLAGTPAATQRLFERGRGNYAASQRSNDITGRLDRANTGIIERAEARTQATNSGRNLDNTIRQRVASVLERPKSISGLSDNEIAALEKVVEGSTTRNISREIGNLLGGGGGIGATATGLISGGSAAIASQNPLWLAAGIVPPVIGTAARVTANSLAKRSLNKADELMRMRSPMYEERVANPELAVVSPEKRAAIARLLMMDAMQGGRAAQAE